MTAEFTAANCELCKRYVLKPEEAVFLRRKNRAIHKVDLGGQQPWAGILCVCDQCCFVLEDIQDKKDRGL